MKERIRTLLLSRGACAVGFARAGEVDPTVTARYEKWIGEGRHGEMAYLERHIPLKRHTDNVLPGAKTVISLAFDYTPEQWRDSDLPKIAAYAYGKDYHTELRKLLRPALEELKREYGGKWRVCIDSAPVAERFWALKSGIGIQGRNGNVIIRGHGSFCFLVELLTTLEIEPDEAQFETCENCGLCVKACPAKAILCDGEIDASKCINYLTIEKKTEFKPAESRLLTSGPFLYGCDECQQACPHNKTSAADPHPSAPESTPFPSAPGIPTNPSPLGSRHPAPSHRHPALPIILSLTPEAILFMTPEVFKKTFSSSPLLYASYETLRRNALALLKNTP